MRFFSVSFCSAVVDCQNAAKHGVAGDALAMQRRPCERAARAPATSCGGAPVTSRDLAVTRRARERHAPARARCVIAARPLARVAAPSAPIGRRRPASRASPCLVPRALAERFIRLPIADETTRITQKGTRPALLQVL
ncbi:unnamed protein product [Colias eurytheme]|nr:unnamed protein product [Colias eurytheme]